MNRTIKTVLFFTTILTCTSVQSAQKEKKTTPTASNNNSNETNFHIVFMGSPNKLEGFHNDIAMIAALLHTFNTRNQSDNNNTKTSDESKK